MSTLSNTSRRSGFSLIEVAIALAIFVFGALAIIQIFPPALGVVRNNENRVTATQMSQATLATLNAKGSFTADAIYDGDATTWNDITYALVGTPSKNNSLPKGMTDSDFQNSALDHFKFVRGEKHTALPGGYVLLPFSATGDIVVYKEEVIEGVQISAAGKLDFSNARRVSSDAVHFNPTNINTQSYPPDDYILSSDGVTDTTYYVSYRWTDAATGRISGVIDEPMNIPAASNGTLESLRVAQSFIPPVNRILPGVVGVRLRKKIDSQNSPYGTRGLVVNLTAGQQYSFDYTVANWRNLVHDDTPRLESGNNYVSALPIQGVSETGYYGLLITYGGTPDITAPVTIRPKTGEAVYTINSPGTWRRTRTVYTTLDGWANQLSVAARSYVPYYTNTQLGEPRTNTTNLLPRPLLPREPWREYYWNPDDPRYLHLHSSEAGKSVVVSFEYDPTPSANDEKVLTNVVLTLDEDIESLSGTSFATLATKTEFTDIAGNPIAGTPAKGIMPPIYPYVTAIISVQGLSIQARTAWINGDRYNQVIVPGYRTLMQ